MSKKPKLGPARMTTAEWEDMMTCWYHKHLEHGAQLALDIIDSAHSVEGGYCYAEVMIPHLSLILGDKYWNLVDFS